MSGLSKNLLALPDYSSKISSILGLELSSLRESIVEFSSGFIGSGVKKYRSPSEGLLPGEFDCSGFVTYVLKYVGLSISGIRHTNEYFDSYGIFVHNPIPGDLVFFSSSGNVPTHIGIYIGDNKFIHKGKSEIVVSTLVNKKIKNPGKGALYSKNPIGFKRISLHLDDLKESRWNKIV